MSEHGTVSALPARSRGAEATARWRNLKRLQILCSVIGLRLSPPSSLDLWADPRVNLQFAPTQSGSNRRFGDSIGSRRGSM